MNRTDPQRGAMQWTIIVVVLLASLGAAVVTTAMGHLNRTEATNDLIALTQRTDVAVADAVAQLSAGNALPATRATATTACDTVGNRPLCSAYWALPRPGNAADPTRYDLITNAWIDKDHDQLPPTDANGVRAVRVPLEAVTYQTRDGLGPKSAAGKIVYTPTPPGAFGNALFGYTSTQLSGPEVSVTSYNSTSGDLGTAGGVVASGGFVSYGTGTAADATILYGSAGAGGVTTTRCTGDTCDESDVSVMTHSYAAASEASVAWMANPSCTRTVEGNWVASEQNARIDTPILCINGSLTVDVATRVTIPSAAVYVRGNIDLAASLNAPALNSLANPAKLFVYSAGLAVSITPTETANPGTSIAAMVYAPRAACSTDPANRKAAGSYAGQVTWYGSLACDTISIGGSWRHFYDDAGTVNYTDPVPGAAKAWTTGTYDVIDTGDKWDIPVGWESGTCVLPAPVDAMAYWRLNEPTGLVARDSAGTSDLSWTTTGRVDGLCGKAAGFRSGGAAKSDQVLRSATAGVTLEWFARGPSSAASGAAVQAAGVRAVIDTTGHVVVTSGGTTAKVPFTVQNRAKSHLYQVTVANDGTITLYVDALRKGTAKAGSPTAGSSTLLADGTAGTLHDVVVYGRVLTEAEVADRWASWNENVAFEITNPGTPITPATNLRDNGTTGKNLRLAWNAFGGTLPPAGEGTADLLVQWATTKTGAFSTLTTQAVTTTSVSTTAPARGGNWYRVCAAYNGDTFCTDAIQVTTIDTPAVPVVFASNITGDSATFSWTAPQDAATYEYQYRVDGGAWSATTSNGAALTRTLTVSGAKIEFQARSVNSVGSSAWSATAIANLIPGTPTLSVSSISTTSAAFAWTSVPGAARYEVRARINGGPWGSPLNVGTGRTYTYGPTNEGSLVELQARALNAADVAGAYSAIATAGLYVNSPTVNDWNTTSTFPTFNVQLKGPSTLCAAGTVPQVMARDRATTTGWNPWGGWVNGSAGASTGPWIVSQVGYYDIGAVQEQQIRCYNPASGNASAPAGPFTSPTLYHPIPTPSGVYIGIVAWHTVQWGGSCPAGTTIYMDWRVYTNSWGWASGTTVGGGGTYYRGENAGWGTGNNRLQVNATCRAGSRAGGSYYVAGGY
ncbi:hypothetical protein CHO01_22750 [Cellulomonas hominis]|uniref:Fibronectin type-III domain-containing protein n=1 Tax=Cellulomonas hominis TaxID=156981 RepID=A0A511FD15_9CELL|nr:hypothetical protein [Cellulomonas hominis]MBB5474605.1 hypothetical protein [Cellulomonas hominis]NKY05478.1 hypothetical protein [Cellulomonas hominis]GEL47159.1 hypothetical protein CHO01_22750 [Cellulomonas hominis]